MFAESITLYYRNDNQTCFIFNSTKNCDYSILYADNTYARTKFEVYNN